MTSLRNDFPAGVLAAEHVSEMFALAQAENFALPAVNCVGSNSMNATMETAGRLNSPVIIQFSTSGSAFVGGKAVPVDSAQASILGSVAGAKHVRTMAEAYNARVILHTDHCPKPKLPWISGLIDISAEHHAATGQPLFNSHMLDLSEEPMEENIDTCVEYLKRMAPLGMTLEIELGITGGKRTASTTQTLMNPTSTQSPKRLPTPTNASWRSRQTSPSLQRSETCTASTSPAM